MVTDTTLIVVWIGQSLIVLDISYATQWAGGGCSL